MNFPPLAHTFTRAFPSLSVPARPEIPTASRVAWVNGPLADSLGLRPTLSAPQTALKFLSGAGEASDNVRALAYSGHQFGQLSPVLGDGRAHLLGEWDIPDARGDSAGDCMRVDLHLKGSGRTPLSRPGSDGKAPLSAVWREVVIGEALTALGVPSTRALAVIDTGEEVVRRSPMGEPAGILVRVASSLLRVGTFQYARMNCSAEERTALVRYALRRHFSHVVDEEELSDSESAVTLLRLVSNRQADLVAQWMGLGFVHGVLNSDNVVISGESVDFGPCAFIDEFRHDAVYSSIDSHGRYAYRNQPAITQWNLARFADTLLDLINPHAPEAAIDHATSILDAFTTRYREAWTSVFAAKLGIRLGEEAPDTRERIAAFATRTLDLLEQDALDFTGFFRTLTDHPETLSEIVRTPGAAHTWLAELRELRATTGTKEQTATELMRASNPVYIPRNHHLEHALRAAERGDQMPIVRILDAVGRPYTRREEFTDLETPPPGSRHFVSFCGT